MNLKKVKEKQKKLEKSCIILSRRSLDRVSWRKLKRRNWQKIRVNHEESQCKMNLKTECDQDKQKKLEPKMWMNLSRMSLLKVSWRKLKWNNWQKMIQLSC